MKKIMMCVLLAVVAGQCGAAPKKPTKKTEQQKKAPPKQQKKAPPKQQKKVVPKQQKQVQPRRAKPGSILQEPAVRAMHREFESKKIAGQQHRQSFVRFITGAGLAGLAGTGMYQMANGHAGIGLGLLGATAGLAVGRSFLLEAMTKNMLKQYAVLAKDFLEQWPHKREHFPQHARAPFEYLYTKMNAGAGSIDGKEVLSLIEGLDAFLLVQQVYKHKTLSMADRWAFVEAALFSGTPDGKDAKPSSFAGGTFAKAVLYLIPSSLLTALLGTLFVARSPAMHRHFARLKDPYQRFTNEADRIQQQMFDRPELDRAWPGRVFGWIDRRCESEYQPVLTFPGFIISLMAIAVLVPFLWASVKSAAYAASYKKAQLARLDVFMRAWPACKEIVPPALVPLCDELYTTSFDHDTQRLRLSDVERRKKLRSILLFLREFKAKRSTA